MKKMTKKQILEYKVIDSSKENKKYFDKHILKSKHTEVLGTFKNEYGELFVIHHEKESIFLYITGDEFSWEDWLINPYNYEITKRFYLNQEELQEVFKIVRKVKTK